MTSPSEVATKTDNEQSSNSSSSYLDSHNSLYLKQKVKNTLKGANNSTIKINKVKPISKHHAKEESINMKSR